MSHAAAPPPHPALAALLSGVRPNAFAAPLGLVGLAGVWRFMSTAYGAPGWVADAVSAAAGLLWLLLAAGAVRRVARTRGAAAADVRDTALSPFVCLPPIVLILLAAVGLAPHARGPAEALFAVGLVTSVVLGSLVLGQWLVGELEERFTHPGYLLPAVGPGLVGAQGAAAFGLTAIGWMCLGLGALAWIMLGSVIFDRLMFRPSLPLGLTSTLVIEIAPPAVAATAYLNLDGGRADPIAYGLAGFAIFMVLAQLRFVPLYRRVPLYPGWWAFTFSWAAVVGVALRWLEIEHPAGARPFAWVLAGAITVFIAVVCAGSVAALARPAR